MKILHITHWYPYSKDPVNGSWIAAHVQALSAYCAGRTYHVEVQGGMRWFFSFRKTQTGVWAFILHLPFRVSLVNEWLATCCVFLTLLREWRTRYDLVNFHIAYPNAVHMHRLMRWFNRKGVITEHWSAYHYGFYAPRKRLTRIISIFRPQLPLLCVSDALFKDITHFSQQPKLMGYVVPNVVDTGIFYHNKQLHHAPLRFFAISRWKAPKRPFVLLQMWQLLLKEYPQAVLRIAGMGPMWQQMQDVVQQAGLEKNIKLLNVLTPTEIAQELWHAAAYLHASDYETFSVVCAEALCCGTPVVASDRGAIPELVDEQSGRLVQENIPEAFLTAIRYFIQHRHLFDRQIISYRACRRFSKETVGAKYYQALKKIVRTT